MNDATTSLPPAAQRDDAAEALWFLGELIIVRLPGEQTADRFSLVEHVCRKGQASPWHRQLHDDETIHVVEGEMSFWAGDPARPILRGGPGTTVFLPKGIPHCFRVESDTARFLGVSTPAGHERFFRAGGEVAPERTLPPEGPPDMTKLEAACRECGVEILGPPPPP